MTERLGDAPIEPAYHAMMNEIAVQLDGLFNGDAKGAERATGFVLLVFPFGEAAEGRTNKLPCLSG